MNDVPPAKRGIAMVFQSYALYPHMSVAQNMAFGLKLAGMSKVQIADAVQRAAQILRIEPLLERKPKDLSGGQRQRVAIGRAIVRKPDVFLFDEPLSNLDALLRVQMRIELANLHRELRSTMIYVTHDQVEAMTLADRIVVLNAGRIEQVGAPLELYHHPANLFVAGFLGSPRMNFLKGKIHSYADGVATIATNAGGMLQAALSSRWPAAPPSPSARAPNTYRRARAGATAAITATVQAVEKLGDISYLYVQVPAATNRWWCAPMPIRTGPLANPLRCRWRPPASTCSTSTARPAPDLRFRARRHRRRLAWLYRFSLDTQHKLSIKRYWRLTCPSRTRNAASSKPP
jgi:multiple sugar transport system ATP-binding protein